MKREVTDWDWKLGQRVHKRRKQLEMSPVTLAFMVGVTDKQIHKYENGECHLSAARLLQIANALEMPIAYFYDIPYSKEAMSLKSGDRELMALPEARTLLTHFSNLDPQHRHELLRMAALFSASPLDVAA